jgi:stage II sporulation protein D
MSRRLCRVTFLGALLSSGCLGSALPTPYLQPSVPAIALPEQVLVRTSGQITQVSLEDYVVAAALSEVTPIGDSPDVVDRIYDVQAVVARTYAVAHLGRHRAEGFDFCDGTHCQMFEPGRRRTSRFAHAAEAAASRTSGQILTFEGRAADALFHADCGGRTAAASAVWGGAPVAYLQAIVDDVPQGAHRTWRIAVGASELRAALNADPRTAVGKSLAAIDVITRDDSGRAAAVGIRGERSSAVKGDILRTVLNRTLGERALQSTLFSVTRQAGGFVFEGVGFGHGVGLCQRGAMARARRGETMREILGTYYPGAKFTGRNLRPGA